MNKNTIKKLFLAIILSYMILPSVVVADTYKSTGSTHSGWETKCTNKFGIDITATKYNRTSGYANGTYYNNVSDRFITIKVPSKTRYKVYFYYAPYGTFNDLTTNDTTNEEDEDADDAVRLRKYTINKKGTKDSDLVDSMQLKLSPGFEALVVVISANKKLIEKDACIKTDKDGKCTKKADIYCKAGKYNFEDGEPNPAEIQLRGVSASLFVQNPGPNDQTNYVENFRYKDNTTFGEACKNAFSGIYDGTENQQIKFNISPDEIEKYRNDYYNKIIGEYCDSQYVPFNLTQNNIKKISNNLIKIYQNSKKLQQENYYTLSYIDNKINDLKNNIKLKYGESNIRDKNTNKSANTTIEDLTCKYKNSRDNDEPITEEYLYITKQKDVNATLSNGTSVKVCSTKCYEHLTVKYDKPAVVKAGLCFSYKVTVKSVTECGVEKDDDFWSKIGKKNMCSPVPICENAASHTQAGPSEDFDNCVNQCDGGKYSQKCINKCYKEVYESAKITAEQQAAIDAKKSASKTQYSNFNNNLTVARLAANTKKDEVYYTTSTGKKLAYSDYYIDKGFCKTSNIINYAKNNSSKLDECAEYFFIAKTLYPYGHYGKTSASWADWQWNTNSNIKNDGATSKTAEAIPMQIGRASPFYVNAKASVLDLLHAITGTGRYSRRYNIDKHGIKRQYNSTYICNATCAYVGCTGADDAKTASEYAKNLSADLEAINNALDDCDATAACTKKEDTTSFDIKVNSTHGRETVVSEEKQATGKTTLGSTVGNTIGLNGDLSIFTPENQEVGTGISGLCYDNTTLNPQYKTTITYPGTWIELKRGARKYEQPQNLNEYKYKDKLFCTPYDATSVNQEYWKWGVNDKFNSNLYPTNFKPVYNISANLGSTNEGFGKYNWKIGFKCFYSISNCVDGSCDDEDKKNECGSENSTQLCNAKFRVVTPENLFPDENGNPKEESKIPFNWTKAAQDKSPEVQAATASNYGVDPSAYKEQVESSAGYANTDPSTAAYQVKINKENINNIKTYVAKHGYTSYQGSYRKVNGIDVYYYTSPLQNDTSLVEKWDRRTELGVNK